MRDQSYKARSGPVAVTVYKCGDKWRFSYYVDGVRKYITRAEFAEAKRLALDKAREIAGGRRPLTGEETALVRAIAELCTTRADLEAHLAFALERAERRVKVGTAAGRFLEGYERGRNLDTYRTNLGAFTRAYADRQIDSLGPDEIGAFLKKAGGTDRTTSNRRRALVTFFRWARDQGHLPDGKATAPERVRIAAPKNKTPDTYTADELAALLGAARAEYVPFIAAGAFLGIRSAEILKTNWEMYRPAEGVFVLPPEITKTNEKRVIPVPAAFLAWAPPAASGPLCVRDPRRKHEGDAETVRLGKTVASGWVKNALRHSFCSYRSAQVGVGQTALEAGNSEAIIRRNYRDAKTADEARAYFNVLPGFQKIA